MFEMELILTTNYSKLTSVNTVNRKTLISQEQTNQNSDKASQGAEIGLVGIGLITIVVFIAAIIFNKNRHSKKNKSVKIDRYQEEFLCGPLKNHYLNNSEKFNNSTNSCTESSKSTRGEMSSSQNYQRKISDSTDEEKVSTSGSYQKNIPQSEPNSLTEMYLKLIDEVVTTILKGEILSQQHIYRKLSQDVTVGTAEVFERCLSERIDTTKLDLDKIVDSPDFFQRETPELQKSRLTRKLKALQTIEKEWEKNQRDNQSKAAVVAAVEEIINVQQEERLGVFLKLIDPNENHPLTQKELQKLATGLKDAAQSNMQSLLQQEIKQIAAGITYGFQTYESLENYIVSWIYELGNNRLGLVTTQERVEPWASWSYKVNSKLPKHLFSTLAVGVSAEVVILKYPYITHSDFVEIIILLQNLQRSLITWFEKQPYDSKWGISTSISTFLSFAIVWCQLSHGFEKSVHLNPQNQQFAKVCFQKMLQVLRLFAHQAYFPLYGGVFALFGGNYLQDTLSYLDKPLQETEGTQEKARILTLLGYSQRILGKYEQALSFHQQALEIACDAEDRPCEIANLNHLSFIYAVQKGYSQAIDNSQRALIRSRQTGDRLGEAYALSTLGYSEILSAQQLEKIDKDTYERIIEYLKRGVEISEKLTDSPYNSLAKQQIQTLCNNSLGIAYVRLQEYQNAIKFLEQASQTSQISGDRYLIGINFLYLGQAYYSCFNLEKAAYIISLGMYTLEQVNADEWHQAANLVNILQIQIGDTAFQTSIEKNRNQIIAIIGVDGYDYLQELLKKCQNSE